MPCLSSGGEGLRVSGGKMGRYIGFGVRVRLHFFGSSHFSEQDEEAEDVWQHHNGIDKIRKAPHKLHGNDGAYVNHNDIDKLVGADA